MSRFEEFNVDSSKNLKQLSTHFDGILKTVSECATYSRHSLP